ncbi:MAG: type II toxin-antitoxin system PemK/MazF family toxin [Candidatus Melainabacteria bacterium]|nr:type II toxin-antitoxin system PemK/MazF family toxin [Candidatus Melainabacteria bacterium]
MIKKNIEKGDIWLVNLNPSRRGELGKNNRPCIVIQANEANKILPTIVIVPLSSKRQKSELEIKIIPNKNNNLIKESYVVWWHVYTVDKLNLIKKVGIINEEILHKVSENIIDTLGFSEVLK